MVEMRGGEGKCGVVRGRRVNETSKTVILGHGSCAIYTLRKRMVGEVDLHPSLSNSQPKSIRVLEGAVMVTERTWDHQTQEPTSPRGDSRKTPVICEILQKSGQSKQP